MSFDIDALRATIGVSGGRRTARHPLGADELRRFTQAVMDPNPAYWDEEAANRMGFPTIVAPPLYPFHAFRPEPGSPDPLDALVANPDWDGLGQADFFGVRLPDVGLHRVLNGGTEAQFFQLACVGDSISAEARIVSLEEKAGRSGTMLVVRIQVDFTNQDAAALARVTTTMLMR